MPGCQDPLLSPLCALTVCQSNSGNNMGLKLTVWFNWPKRPIYVPYISVHKICQTYTVRWWPDNVCNDPNCTRMRKRKCPIFRSVWVRICLRVNYQTAMCCSKSGCVTSLMYSPYVKRSCVERPVSRVICWFYSATSQSKGTVIRPCVGQCEAPTMCWSRPCVGRRCHQCCCNQGGVKGLVPGQNAPYGYERHYMHQWIRWLSSAQNLWIRWQIHHVNKMTW